MKFTGFANHSNISQWYHFEQCRWKWDGVVIPPPIGNGVMLKIAYNAVFPILFHNFFHITTTWYFTHIFLYYFSRHVLKKNPVFEFDCCLDNIQLGIFHIIWCFILHITQYSCYYLTGLSTLQVDTSHIFFLPFRRNLQKNPIFDFLLLFDTIQLGYTIQLIVVDFFRCFFGNPSITFYLLLRLPPFLV